MFSSSGSMQKVTMLLIHTHMNCMCLFVFIGSVKILVQGVQLKSGPYFNMNNSFTKIYNMLYYTANLYLQ
jgi:hypothetical protein